MFGCRGSVIKRNLVPLLLTREEDRQTDRQTGRERGRGRGRRCCGHTCEFENIVDGRYLLRGLRYLRNLRRGIFVLLLHGHYHSATINERDYRDTANKYRNSEL